MCMCVLNGSSRGIRCKENIGSASSTELGNLSAGIPLMCSLPISSTNCAWATSIGMPLKVWWMANVMLTLCNGLGGLCLRLFLFRWNSTNKSSGTINNIIKWDIRCVFAKCYVQWTCYKFRKWVCNATKDVLVWLAKASLLQTPISSN